MKGQLKNPWQIGGQWFYSIVKRLWFELSLSVILLYLFFSKGLDFQLKIGGKPLFEVTESVTFFEDTLDTRLSLIPDLKIPRTKSANVNKVSWKSSDFSKLAFILNPDLAFERNVPSNIVEQKFNICFDYISQYLPSAKQSATLHKVPVSITLAQALLESNAGMSDLAVESNNHFGIKCKQKCLGCTCRNYSDDDKYDMFRMFDTADESFEAHAKLLDLKRYADLKRYGNDYRKWAVGLKKAGYATDEHYAEKLILIIETLKLYQYVEAA